MKKISKISAIMLAFLICAVCVFSVSAAEFEYEGYTYSIVNNSSVSLTGWDDRSDNLIIPNKIQNRKVISVGNGAIGGHTNLTSIDFSQCESLERIGMAAFSSCSGINQEIVLPGCVTEINICAFQYCSSLPSVVVNSNVTEIPNQCFYQCSSLKTATLNEGIERIGYYAFAGCTDLERVDIPRSVTLIERSSFENDENLVLGVYNDTYGHQYAVNNRIDHIILDGDKTGDVNGDGVVDILDATEIQKYAAESTDFTDEQFELGDINKDGYCDVIDALLVQKSVIGAYEIPPIVIRY